MFLKLSMEIIQLGRPTFKEKEKPSPSYVLFFVVLMLLNFLFLLKVLSTFFFQKKLEAFLQKWQEEGSSVEYKHVPSAITHLLSIDKVESVQVNAVSPNEAHNCLDSSCAADSVLIHPSDSHDVASSVYSSAILTSSPHSQLYVVKNEISVEHPPQLVQCTLANMKSHLPIGVIGQQKEVGCTYCLLNLSSDCNLQNQG